MNEIERIKALSNAFGPSGKEDDVVELVRREMNGIVGMEEDTMRNLYLKRKDKAHKHTILMDSHTDEVGYIIQAVKPNGTLAFLPLGGQDAKNSCAQRVMIQNRKGQFIKGIVSAKPVHFETPEERKQAVDFKDLQMDVGASSKEEVEKDYDIGPGCFAVSDVDCQYDEQHGLFIGKAFDNRIGTAAMMEVFHRVKDKELNTGLTGIASSQEEVGERGMKAAVQKVHGSMDICFEGCPADDNVVEPYLVQSALGKGPMVRHFDVSMITNPRLMRFVLDTAHKYDIPVQESVRKGGGTNGGVLHTSNIPTIVIGIPVRYAHSANNFCSIHDYENAVKLAVKIIETVTDDILESF